MLSVGKYLLLKAFRDCGMFKNMFGLGWVWKFIGGYI
jgi:hypothetical protein